MFLAMALAGQDVHVGQGSQGGSRAPAEVEVPDRVPAPAKNPMPAGKPQIWMMGDDYPAGARAARMVGTVRFRLEIDAAGKVTGCHVLSTSGYWRLDEGTCSVMSRNARFRPALDAQGKPVPSTFSSQASWALNGLSDLRNWEKAMADIAGPVGIEVSVAALPATYRYPALVRVRFDGDRPACVVELGSGSAAADKVACDQALAAAPRPDAREGLVARPDTRIYQVHFVAGGKGSR